MMPNATLHAQPQAASQLPPNGYTRLGDRPFREPGDLVWTMAGWIVCNLSTGIHPEGVIAARKSPIEAGPIHIPSERIHAPLRCRQNAEWLSQSTPLFYLVETPFEDEEVRVFQMHQLKAAVAIMRDKEVHYASLFISYLDHRTGLYEAKRLQWVTYEHDPADSETPESKNIRVIQDPYELYVLP